VLLIFWVLRVALGAGARVFRRVGLHERSASRQTHYFLLDRFTVTGLFYARTLPLVSCSVTLGRYAETP